MSAARPAPPTRPAPSPLRPLAMLFVDLSDSTALSAAMAPEDYAEMQAELRTAFREEVERRGGLVNQFQGDGLQAVFGHPRPDALDACRATEAALEMHARVRSLPLRRDRPPIRVHTGVHAGAALVRPGGDASAKLDLFGPVPGLCKHLSDIAEADELLVSEEALGAFARRFETGERRLVVLKGRDTPMAVLRVLACRAPHGVKPATAPPVKLAIGWSCRLPVRWSPQAPRSPGGWSAVPG